MEINLATPYNNVPSPPHEPRIVFWSCQSKDLIFPAGRDVEIRCRGGLRSVGMTWELSRNLFKQPFLEGEAEALPTNSFVIRIPAASLKPGFFDLRVSLDSGDGKPVPAISTFGYDVDHLPLTLDRPADFTKFWDDGKAELGRVALSPKAEEATLYKGKQIDAYNLAYAALPGDYDPKGHRHEDVEAFKISFASAGGLRVHGWLAKPQGKGPFPAMLVLPGAGFAARPAPLEHARHGYLSLDVQIHGQDVDQKEYPWLPGYYDHFVFDPPRDYYYRRTYLNALQAANYLASRDDVDKDRIVVVGGSQGGRLTTVVASQDHRIAAAAPAIAHFANIPYLKWVEQSNAANPPCDGMGADAPPPLPDTPEGRCMGYYDIMSFAPDIRCPVMMNAGLIDAISPPSGVFAVYNQLGTKNKQMVPLSGLGHDWSAEFDRMAWRWLDKVLRLG